jgi:glutaredoxin
MKKITMFYQERCPFCRRAFQYIDELKNENPAFKDIEIETIEETLHPDIADQYDYYYVPTFYIDGKKVHEAGIFKNEMKELLEQALEK